MQPLSTLDTAETIDFDNLNIVTHPRPPRRRQSGVSLVPFRPYVKCLTSVREPFSYADGEHEWKTSGQKETFFKQQNARCIGSLMDDCDISDVIRWDIEGESTRLPMMCKLWMIVDGAVVERGKPHLVQDAAVQVLTAGRNRRSILAAEQRYSQTATTTLDRRRRHSWHDLNEYHSVPYFQYSRSARTGYQDGVQCDLDNEHVTSTQEYLSFIEETLEENLPNQFEHDTARETIHDQSTLQDRVHISIMTQTEHLFEEKSTSIDSDFVQLFNLNLEANENLLSTVVNPYQRVSTYVTSFETGTFQRNGLEFQNQSVSTGDDYPQWWNQLSTNIILSDQITNQGEEKQSNIIPSSPRQQLDQSIQTDIDNEFDNETEKTRPPSSSRSSRIQKSSSSMTINDHFEIIDQSNDGNNSKRLVLPNDQYQRKDSDSHLSDYPMETSSNNRLRRITTSSKQSDSDYHTFASALNQQSYSTPEPYHYVQTTSGYSSTNENEQQQQTKPMKTTETTSTNGLANLRQRYERTLQSRQKPLVTIHDQSLDIQNLIQHYKDKVQNTEKIFDHSSTKDLLNIHRNHSTLIRDNKEESSSLSISHLHRTKYRTMPEITSKQMLQGYVPIPRLYLTHTSIDLPRQYQSRFDYCDLCLNDHSTSSAWIKYTEQRIDQLQKRIDLMLEIDDFEENLLFSINDPLTQRIEEVNKTKSKYRNPPISYHHRILLPPRYNFRYPYRQISNSLPNSPRLLTRNLTRSTRSIGKTVRISTDPEPFRLRQPLKCHSRPIVSILRRPHSTPTIHSQQIVEPSHVWKDDSDGKVYILNQFSIPRYYRLYNDVSFREVYYFSRLLDNYLNRTTTQNYTNIVRNYAIQQQLPTVTSLA